MPQTIDRAPNRSRISIDVDPALRRRIRLAAANRDLTVRQYLLETIEQRLGNEVADIGAELPLTASTDPVLAELWQYERDAEYDRL